MPKSKLNPNYKFYEDEWVVSFINTKVGITSIIGGHAKIVVEGIRGPQGDNNNNNTDLFSKEFFVGEYHIMEANRIVEETWIPQALRNTQCDYVVLFTERNEYTERQEQQYREVSSRTVGGMQPIRVLEMIENIKQERDKINAGEIKGEFQYGGKWRYGCKNGRHNCTTWAEEKLKIIGIGKDLITDSSKAIPFPHVNSADILDSSRICSLV